MANEKRLIDANALKVHINGVSTHWLNDWSTLGVLAAVDKQPTVDAVPVVHGEWEKYTDDKFMGYGADGRTRYRKVYSYKCSKCWNYTAVKHNYCPNYGARMDG